MFHDPEGDRGVFRSRADVDAFKARHSADVHPPSALWSFDFTSEQVVMVALEPQDTGMTVVEIVGIEEQPDRFLVHTVVWGPDGAATCDMGHPCHYVVMELSTKPIEFAPLAFGYLSQRP